ncbi:MAG: pyruvate ferredoxin oxidoreductase, partial [Candidatus Electrothrix sp. ATG2]|nr:pyruvate ferredoxin oxidoreductase [Candidatus Electrothrix sp. ATG2]
MYRIRFHGRGGQGVKTAGRILGTTFFQEGFAVQDAPRYGAERRGAPIFAYVRASRLPIQERGIIRRPDLVVVVDDSLLTVPAAGVLTGVDEQTCMLISTSEEAATWRHRLNFPGQILTLPAPEEITDRMELRSVAATCAGAAARLCGLSERTSLERALREELSGFADAVVEKN